MNTSRDRRLARLEQVLLAQESRPAGRTIYVWHEAQRESVNAAIARRCRKGIPSGARIVICSWQFDDARRDRN